MNTLRFYLAGAVAMMATIANAHAVTCAEGVYRAGCAGPNGAAVVRKPAPPPAVVVAPPPRAVVTPAPRAVVVPPPHGCVWVDGRRVCR
ncbi:MAG: hypothetical protein HT580_11445 [Dechloromonas sp.]|nr:MAG: hypothetical protein HT580_11445 [Dechloromonas sp.]